VSQECRLHAGLSSLMDAPSEGKRPNVDEMWEEWEMPGVAPIKGILK